MSLPPVPLFFFFFLHLLYSYLFLTETHECAGSPVRIETTDHSYANPPPTHVRNVNTERTATHNAPAICSFISLEHPALVRTLEFINIHATFIYGNIAHGVGVLVSGTGQEMSH